jgi:hypothetical protein
VLQPAEILEHGIEPNEILLAQCWRERDPSERHHLATEMIDVFGMAGRTVFETCVWIGRFIEAWGTEDYTKVTRHDVKVHLGAARRSRRPGRCMASRRTRGRRSRSR